MINIHYHGINLLKQANGDIEMKYAMVIYKVDWFGEDVYFSNKQEAIKEWQDTIGSKKSFPKMEKLYLGEGWTQKKLMLEMLNGNGYIAKREPVKL